MDHRGQLGEVVFGGKGKADGEKVEEVEEKVGLLGEKKGGI